MSRSQMVSLVCHTNAVAQTNQFIDFPIDDQPLHDRYSFQFVSVGSDSYEETIASDITGWIEWLRQQGLVEARLVFKPARHPNCPDAETYQIPNLDDHWSMIVRCRDVVSRWTVQQVLANESEKSDPDWEPAWNVRYAGKPCQTDTESQGGSLEAAESRLWHAIHSANEYAKTFHNTERFIHWLQQGLFYLQCNEEDLARYFPSWGKINATHQARRLLAAADAGWVFGGMESWNEPWYTYENGDKERYHAITTELYDALCSATVTAINSTTPRSK